VSVVVSLYKSDLSKWIASHFPILADNSERH